MSNIHHLLRFVTDPNHIFTYLLIAYMFLCITLLGAYVMQSMMQRIIDTSNKFLLLGLSMIIGAFTYVAYTSVMTYLLKGELGLKIQWFLLSVCVLWILITKKLTFATFTRIHWSLNNILTAFVTLLYASFFTLIVGNTVIGGDASTYWGIATSFARGNYPTYLPWQPSYLTTYHHGAFVLLGGLHGVTSINISLIHFGFSLYILIALWFTLVGIAREYVKSVVAVLPAIVGVIAFGPLFWWGNILSYLSQTLQFIPSLNQIVASETIIHYSKFTGAAGSGANRIDGFVYSNFLAFAFTGVLAWIYFAVQKNNLPFLKKHALLITLAVLITSVTITYGIIIGPLYLFILYRDLRKQRFTLTSMLRDLTILGIFGGISLIVFQNPIRDGLFVPQPDRPRFTLLHPSEPEFANRLSFNAAKNVNTEGSWYLPQLSILVLVSIITAAFTRNPYTIALSIVAATCWVASLTTVNTYWPSNGFRFSNKAYQFTGICLTLSLILFFHTRKWYAKGVAGLVLFTMTPGIINAHVVAADIAMQGEYANLKNFISYQNEILDHTKQFVNAEEQVIFLDEFPEKTLSSSLTGDAITMHGISVPVSPPGAKVLSVEYSSEWFDAVSSLNPLAIRILGVDYVVIKTERLNNVSAFLKDTLNNPSYFDLISTQQHSAIYKVRNEFLQYQNWPLPSIQSIIESIPSQQKIYIDTMPFNEIRKGLILGLGSRSTIVGPQYSVAGDYFMYVEKDISFIASRTGILYEDIDYAIMKKDATLTNVATGNFQKVYSHPYVDVWKKIK